MDLSIIIPSHNTIDLLRNCLRSIFDSNPQVEFEVIVVDNASQDGSPEMVKTEFPAVKLISNSENRGFAAACNQGIYQSHGRYIFLLNSDTLVVDDSLDKLVSFADEHPDAGVIGCALLNSNYEMTKSFCYGFIAPCPARSTKPVELRNGWVSGAAMLINRRAGNEVGWLDEDFFFGSEDVEICWRMIKSGWKVYYTPDPKIVHLESRSSKKQDFYSKARVEARRGAWLKVQKHGTPLQKAAWRSLRFLQDFVSVITYALKGEFDKIPFFLKRFK